MLALATTLHAVEPPSVRERNPAVLGPAPINCGTLAYDDGTAENTLFFAGGGHAGFPDHFFAVQFLLADFNLQPGELAVAGMCAGNSFDLTAVGGPWPNEIFVYPDNNGLPDLDRPLRHLTMVTGDGSGPFIGEFAIPVVIDGDFWLLNQGFPAHDGEDFNMETDQSSEPLKRSYITDRGLPFIFQTEQNLILRANLIIVQPAQAIPTISLSGWLLMVMALSLLSWRRLRRG